MSQEVLEVLKTIAAVAGGGGFLAKVCGIIIVAKKLGWRKLWARLKELVGSEINKELNMDPKPSEKKE